MTVASASVVRGVAEARGVHTVVDVPVILPRLPKALDGFTIVQLSDLHVGLTIDREFVARVVEITNGLSPDLIALTGDFVDGSVADLREDIAPLAGLRAKHGVFAITGNHEYYAGAEAWMEYLTRLGVRVLRNERVALGDGTPGGATFDLAGVHDHAAAPAGTPGAMDLAQALAGRDPERGLVLMAHQPRQADTAAAVRAGVELQLSGHTHGGQLFPWSLAVRAAFPYVKGLYRVADAGAEGQVYVNRGTGYWGPPMRLGAPPEITRLVLTA
jgi:predicted MPP superfamily phosphohydrolase